MKRNDFEQFRRDLETHYDVKEVADASGVSNSTLRNWIKGIALPQYRTLLRVAPILGYSIKLQLRRTK